MWHVQTLLDQVSPSFKRFFINQPVNSYQLKAIRRCVKTSYEIYGHTSSLQHPFSIYSPDPLSSLHSALCNWELIFSNRLPWPLVSSWGSLKEEHQQEIGGWEGSKVEVIIPPALSSDLHALVGPSREPSAHDYPFPVVATTSPIDTSDLEVETPPHISNCEVLNHFLLVLLSTLYILVSGPLVKCQCTQMECASKCYSFLKTFENSEV